MASAEEEVQRWFGGLTDEDISRMSDDVAREAAKIMEIANVLLKLKQAEGTGLNHVVLSADEIKALMRLLRTLQSDHKKK